MLNRFSHTPPGQRRVLVTGSRGKSSLVRLIHAACRASEIRAYGRITGVLPRQLGPKGESLILRRAGSHVAEMPWWLKRLPKEADAIILENSAISPELQHLAAKWLKPGLVVLSNVLPDHQQAWGDGKGDAARTLVRGVPPQSRVVLPVGEMADLVLLELLQKRGCRIIPAEPAAGSEPCGHQAVNQGLALAACKQMGLDPAICREAMAGIAPDLADFRVLRIGKASLALGFSANDPASTWALFDSLGWDMPETTLLYNHRVDRLDRLRAFGGLLRHPWQEVLIIGQRPWPLPKKSRFVKLRGPKELSNMLSPGGRYFGCGNLAGPPLGFLLERRMDPGGGLTQTGGAQHWQSRIPA
jgi:hypothetical protein